MNTIKKAFFKTTNNYEGIVEWSATHPTTEIKGMLDYGWETVFLRSPYQSCHAKSIQEAANILAKYHDLGDINYIRDIE
jgi:hypothetical protein